MGTWYCAWDEAVVIGVLIKSSVALFDVDASGRGIGKHESAMVEKRKSRMRVDPVGKFDRHVTVAT